MVAGGGVGPSDIPGGGRHGSMAGSDSDTIAEIHQLKGSPNRSSTSTSTTNRERRESDLDASGYNLSSMERGRGRYSES